GEAARVDVADRGQALGAEGGRGVDPDVELAEAFEDGAAQTVDAAAVDQVEGHQGRVLARGGENGVVQLFERTLGAAGGDDVGAGLRQGEGGFIADAARGADDEGDTVFEGKLGHGA